MRGRSPTGRPERSRATSSSASAHGAGRWCRTRACTPFDRSCAWPVRLPVRGNREVSQPLSRSTRESNALTEPDGYMTNNLEVDNRIMNFSAGQRLDAAALPRISARTPFARTHPQEGDESDEHQEDGRRFGNGYERGRSDVIQRQTQVRPKN